MKNGNAAANRFGCGAMEKPKNLKLKFMKKEITKFLSANRISLAFIALTLPWGGGVKSQEQMDGVPWTGEALPAESGEYYLYNKAGDGFLLGANSWSTQASLGQPGLLCTIVVSNGKYKIVTNAGKDGNGIRDGYIDKDPTEWDFTDPTPDDGMNEFVISSGGNRYFYWKSGTALSTDGGSNMENAQWLLVSQEQRINSLDKASSENPIDASFYIANANFTRSLPTGWNEKHTGGSITIVGPNNRGAQETNSCTEAYNNDNFDIYQELTDLKNGVYVVSCQGYYRPGKNISATGAQNAVLYANEASTPLQLLYDDGNGVPNDMKTAADAFLAGRYSGNNVQVIVTNGKLRIGVKKDVKINEDWTAFDTFRLTYYGNLSDDELMSMLLGELQEVQNIFNELGAAAIANTLNDLYEQYKEAEYAVAQSVISPIVESAKAAQGPATAMQNALEAAKAFMEQVNNNKYDVSEASKTALETNITTTKKLLAEASIKEMAAQAPETTANLTTANANAQSYADLCFNLTTAKALADAIGGLSENEAYKQIETDLAAASLGYAAVASHVAALNAVSRTAMTEDFLANASAKNPIDFTCFIKNPNVYQTGERTQAANDWSCNKGSADGGDYTNGTLNTELYCYSWTGWRIKESQYSQQLSDLPDGAYKLEAATCTNFGSGNIYLYASIDNANILWNTNFNDNENTYNEACADLATTTSLTFVVQGGNIHIGIIGNKDTGAGGNGRWWKADNFRLYYIGTPEDLDITVSDAGYATYYAPNAFTMPEGLTGGIAKSVDTDANKLTIDWCYQPGSTVPGLTGIILQGKQGEYKGVYAEAVPAPEGNLLQGTLAAKNIAEAGYLYYKLANDPENGIGFYWDAAEGTSINNGANKAYLAIEQTPEASETNFFLWDWEATGIAGTVADESAPVDVYTLSGIRVRTQVAPAEALDGLQKGIYIVNGKKVIK